MTTTTKTTAHTSLIAAAKAEGYSVRATYVECPGCKKVVEAYMKEKGLDTMPIYMTTKTAIKFTKVGKDDVIACPDGHRTLVPKTVYKERPKCKNYGKEVGDRTCRSCIGQKEIEENGGYCWKCRPAQKAHQPAPENKATMGKAPKTARICKTNGCNNELPEDRKSYCYTCRPKAAPKASKEAAQEVVM